MLADITTTIERAVRRIEILMRLTGEDKSDADIDCNSVKVDMPTDFEALHSAKDEALGKLFEFDGTTAYMTKREFNAKIRLLLHDCPQIPLVILPDGLTTIQKFQPSRIRKRISIKYLDWINL